MKRQLPLLLLFIVLFNLMGYFLLFGGLEVRAKKYARELINLPELSFQPAIIAFPRINAAGSSAKIIASSAREFRWNGAMYDVLKKEITADSVIFYCFEDRNETELISCFLEYLSQNASAGDQEQAKFSLKKIVSFYYEGIAPFSAYLQASEFRYPHCFSADTQFFSVTAAQPPDFS